jgi:subtilisin family serine protease
MPAWANHLLQVRSMRPKSIPEVGQETRGRELAEMARALGGTVLALCALCFPLRAQEELTRYSLSQISSMAVLTRPNGSVTIFIADASSGIIYSHSMGTGNKISLFEFKPFFMSSVYKRPVGIATHGNSLLVCDGAVPAVVSIDLDSHRLTSIIEGVPLNKPSAIAISSSGTIAVVNSEQESIVWVFPGSTMVTSVSGVVAHPGVAVFEKRNLLLEDLSTHSFYRIVVPTTADLRSPSRSAEVYARTGQLTGESRYPIRREDFAVANRLAIANGILYLSDGKDITAMEDENAVPLPVTLRDYPVESATAMVATRDNLFVADSVGETLWKLPLVVPALVDFEVESNVSHLNESLSAFYSYLFSSGVLSVQTVHADKNYSSLWEFLVSRGLLLPSPCCGSEKVEETLSGLLFNLNATLFTNSMVQLKGNVSAGTDLTVPKVDAKKRLGSVGVKLATKNISSEVKSRVVSTDLLNDINAEYIGKLNSVLPRDIETVLNKMGLDLANPPSEALNPGMLLVVGKSGGYKIVGSLGECGAELAISSTPVSLPQVVGAPITTLPAYKNSMASATSQTDTSNVQMDITSASLESISRSDIAGFLNTAKGRTCTTMIARRKAYLITKALKISGVEYTFLGAQDTATASPLWKSAQVTGNFKFINKKTLVTNLPFYLGFEVVKIHQREMTATFIGKVQSKSTTFESVDSAFRGVEQINLPVEQWSVRVNVPATDLHNEKSDLYKFDGLDVLSTEDLNANAAGYGVSVDQTPSTIETAQANRSKLQAEVHFDPSMIPADMALTIGIAEEANSVDMQHPAFWDQNMKSPWHTVDANLAVQTVQRGDSEAEIVNPVAFQKSDHGTHVAGLIASRNGKLGQGFAPRASLLLIDTSSAASLSQSITAAINNQVYVFSFSFDVDRGPAWSTLKKQIQDKAKDRLFVVAAGDNGDDLRNLELAPVGWVGEGVENIIGVAAADWDKQILGEFLDDQGIKQNGSNYGPKYVQLAAPGKDIYSAVKGGGYAKASGSSQAVPLVAAAAAILIAEGISDPLVLKQRLLYTADWYRPNFSYKLWGGGLLNIQRAVWQPRSNLLLTQTDTKHVKALTLSDGNTIRIQTAETDEPNVLATIVNNQDISFQNILRITMQTDGKFRVIFQQDGKMKVLNDALLDGFIQCDAMGGWSEAKTFVDDGGGCKDPIPVQQIFDYVAATPKSAR